MGLKLTHHFLYFYKMWLRDVTLIGQIAFTLV